MPIIPLLVTLIIIGVILWLVNTYVPIDPPIKAVINVIIVIALCIWLLNSFGLIDYTIPIRR